MFFHGYHFIKYLLNDLWIYFSPDLPLSSPSRSSRIAASPTPNGAIKSIRIKLSPDFQSMGERRRMSFFALAAASSERYAQLPKASGSPDLRQSRNWPSAMGGMVIHSKSAIACAYGLLFASSTKRRVPKPLTNVLSYAISDCIHTSM